MLGCSLPSPHPFLLPLLPPPPPCLPLLQVYWVVGFSPTVRFLMFWLQLFLINLWSIGLFQVGGQLTMDPPLPPCHATAPARAGQAGCLQLGNRLGC